MDEVHVHVKVNLKYKKRRQTRRRVVNKRGAMCTDRKEIVCVFVCVCHSFIQGRMNVDVGKVEYSRNIKGGEAQHSS